MTVKVEGLDEAITSLNDRIKRIKVVSQAGFWEAGLKIMRAAQLRLRASVITGNLRASGYVRSNMQQVRPEPEKLIGEQSLEIPSDQIPPLGVELGFTAVYALYAHENMEGRAPKFLENVVRENESKIAEIIEKRVEKDGESR